MKNIRLSHSAIEMYKECPQMYKFKYIDKYRETIASSALFFGSSVGDTFQMIILDRKTQLTEEEKEIIGSDPYEFFDSKFSCMELNGETIELINNPRARYFKGDYDETVLQEEDLGIIESYRTDNGFEDFNTFDMLWGEYKSGKATEAEMSFLNLHFWLALRRKGHLMIKEFLTKINPKIIKVYEIEGQINLDNGHGGTIIGYLDLLCDYQFEDGIKRCIVDFKTSSAKYAQKKLDESQQLSLYDYAKEVGYVGYVVAIKKIKNPKRGARKGEQFSEIQELFGVIPESKQEEIIEGIDEVMNNIQNEEFPRKKNTKECERIYGKRCVYYNLCFYDDDSGLFKKEKK